MVQRSLPHLIYINDALFIILFLYIFNKSIGIVKHIGVKCFYVIGTCEDIARIPSLTKVERHR